MAEDRVAVFEIERQQRAKTYPASPLELFAEELAATYNLELGAAHYGRQPLITHGLFRRAERDGAKEVTVSYRREPIAASKSIDIEQAVQIMTEGPKNELLTLILDDGKNPEVVRVKYDPGGGVVSVINLRAEIAYIKAKLDVPGKTKPVFAFNLPFGSDQLDKAIAFTRSYLNLNR